MGARVSDRGDFRALGIQASLATGRGHVGCISKDNAHSENVARTETRAPKTWLADYRVTFTPHAGARLGCLAWWEHRTPSLQVLGDEILSSASSCLCGTLSDLRPTAFQGRTFSGAEELPS